MLFLPEEQTGEAWEPSKKHFSFRKSGIIGKKSTVELHSSGRWLSGSDWPFRQICREFWKTNLPWNHRL